MGLSEIKQRLQKKKQQMQEQMERGRQRTVEMKIKKEKRQMKKLQKMKPGAKKTLITAIKTKTPLSGVWSQVMKPELERRKYERNKEKT